MANNDLLKNKKLQPIWNPLKDYHKKWNIGFDPFDLKMLMTNRKAKRLDKVEAESFAANYTRNIALRRDYSYAIPSDKIAQAIKDICKSDVIEIGAGLGYWAKYLEQFDINVLAFDPKGSDRAGYFNNDQEFHPVIEGGIEQVPDNSDRALLLCWPPYKDPVAYEALSIYKGDYLIYIGESEGGCTADDMFFELLDKEWELVYSNHEVMDWWGLHSAEYIYKRKTVSMENQSARDEIY